MITKERLLAIPDLNIAGKIERMSDMQFTAYVNSLNSFVDGIPTLSANMRSTLSSKAYSALALQLKNACTTLTKFHADKLVAQCNKHISTLSNAKEGSADHEAIEAFIEDFILSISALSIEIQMGTHRSSGTVSTYTPSAPRASAPVSTPAPSRPSGGYPSILAVDNAVMFLNTLKKMLSDAPYDLHCMTSCHEALQYLNNHRPDMFLLDIEMPEMDGYELARRIKSSGQRAPIIFITANSDRKYVDQAVEVGAAGLLMKPLRISQLLARIKEFI